MGGSNKSQTVINALGHLEFPMTVGPLMHIPGCEMRSQQGGCLRGQGRGEGISAFHGSGESHELLVQVFKIRF